MNRNNFLKKLKENKAYDFVIIGGGATGIGVALEASTRGYSVALFEKYDFTKSTSSKSTKLMHGGVRYLAQGNVALVREAVIERGLITQNASHLVKNLSFVIPTHNFIDEVKYTIGLKLYDFIAGKLSLGGSYRISKSNVLKRVSTINPDKITAGVLYHDGQFDDSRLAINLLQTAIEYDAIGINYCGVDGLIKGENGKVEGVTVTDEVSGNKYSVKAKQVINATGVFADDILKMDDQNAEKSLVPSQGVHIVLEAKFLPGKDAIMIPKTTDGRVLFLVPWHNKVVVGTTDTLIDEPAIEPVALEKEIDFILQAASYYLTEKPKRSDVLSVFAGLRPLAAPKKSSNTKEISRSHSIITSKSGMITMVGGKWTTFRKMAEELVNKAESNNQWNPTQTKTTHLKIHGYRDELDENNPLYFYGADEEKLLKLAKEENLNVKLNDELPVISAQVVWAVRNEMCLTIEDFLARRTRCQLLNARESIKMAPLVAALMAKELGKNASWIKEQVQEYKDVTENYILKE